MLARCDGFCRVAPFRIGSRTYFNEADGLLLLSDNVDLRKLLSDISIENAVAALHELRADEVFADLSCARGVFGHHFWALLLQMRCRRRIPARVQVCYELSLL